MVLSWEGGDTRVGGASSPAEGSPAKTSRVGKANLRIQPMPQHNKAHFLYQPQSQDGSAWVLPRDLPKTIQSRPRELQKSRPKRERAPFRAGISGPTSSGDHLQMSWTRRGRVMGGRMCSGAQAGGASSHVWRRAGTWVWLLSDVAFGVPGGVSTRLGSPRSECFGGFQVGGETQ